VGSCIGENLGREEVVIEEKSEEERKLECQREKEKGKEQLRSTGETTEKQKASEKAPRGPPIGNVPHPHAPSRKDEKRQFIRFMNVLKRLQINSPFTEALEQMPIYAKFIKELLTKKRKLPEQETI